MTAATLDFLLFVCLFVCLFVFSGGTLVYILCDPSQHNCRKDYVRREGAIENKWENNWGFLIGQYRTVRGTLLAFTVMADIGEKIQPGLEPGLEPPEI